jgi:hypothetical protein
VEHQWSLFALYDSCMIHLPNLTRGRWQQQQ